MVKGMEKFREYFADYREQYVLIGGAACDILFTENNSDFRATRDLDIVLVVEALTKEFGDLFWKFINDGEYQNRTKNNSKPQFYRFDKPTKNGFPQVLELFAKTDIILTEDKTLTPIHIDDSVSSLSAILLDDDYYEIMLKGRIIVKDISILKSTYLIPFKAKAWLDLQEKKKQGKHVDSRDIKKHKNDIIRITSEMSLERDCEFPDTVKNDMELFIEMLQNETTDMKNLKLSNVSIEDIVALLKEIYCR
ncbi:MAG: hypothetical protein JJE03_01070 [Peptostreptococcaceae bacterium]|nr:hypothetical protein [Peptostreptococcaceae bacterium]